MIPAPEVEFFALSHGTMYINIVISECKKNFGGEAGVAEGLNVFWSWRSLAIVWSRTGALKSP